MAEKARWISSNLDFYGYVVRTRRTKYEYVSSVRMTRKTKLTLSVDEETVKKAKALGINISELTEEVLRAHTITPDEESRDAVVAKYRALFDQMLPLLKEYETSVQIARYPLRSTSGAWVDDEGVYLMSDGEFFFDVEEAAVEFERLKSVSFLPPDKIIQNFIAALSRAKGERREKLEALEMARRLVEVIVQSQIGGEEEDRPNLPDVDEASQES